MSLGRYNPRKRYLERGRKRNSAMMVALAAFVLVSTISFWLGRQQASFQLSSQKKEIQEMRKQATDLQNEATGLRANAQTATSRFDQLQTQYQEDLPEEGPMRNLVELVRKQLKDGMSPERLAFVIRSARPPRNCSDPASKRFMVKTPAYKGPESSAAFGEGAVIITANGLSSRSSGNYMFFLNVLFINLVNY